MPSKYLREWQGLVRPTMYLKDWIELLRPALSPMDVNEVPEGLARTYMVSKMFSECQEIT